MAEARHQGDSNALAQLAAPLSVSRRHGNNRRVSSLALHNHYEQRFDDTDDFVDHYALTTKHQRQSLRMDTRAGHSSDKSEAVDRLAQEAQSVGSHRHSGRFFMCPPTGRRWKGVGLQVQNSGNAVKPNVGGSFRAHLSQLQTKLERIDKSIHNTSSQAARGASIVPASAYANPFQRATVVEEEMSKFVPNAALIPDAMYATAGQKRAAPLNKNDSQHQDGSRSKIAKSSGQRPVLGFVNPEFAHAFKGNRLALTNTSSMVLPSNADTTAKENLCPAFVSLLESFKQGKPIQKSCTQSQSQQAASQLRASSTNTKQQPLQPVVMDFERLSQEVGLEQTPTSDERAPLIGTQHRRPAAKSQPTGPTPTVGRVNLNRSAPILRLSDDDEDDDDDDEENENRVQTFRPQSMDTPRPVPKNFGLFD